MAQVARGRYLVEHVAGCGGCHTPLDPELISHIYPERASAWDATAGDALGYLHANCGSCHNPNGSARPDSDLDLRLSINARELAETGAYRTAVGKQRQSQHGVGPTLRIEAGAPEESALFVRMGQRGTALQMPPLASELTDPAGLHRVREWIGGL